MLCVRDRQWAALAAGMILHLDMDRQLPRRYIRSADRNLGGFCLQKFDGPLHGSVQDLGLRLDIQVLTMILQHALHDEVSAHESVTVHARTGLTIQSGHGDSFVHHRHVTTLAGLLVYVVAVLPLQERHLLGKAADFFHRFGPARR